MLLALTKDEIDQICMCLTQTSAKNRFLKGLGLTVRKRRERTPLVNRYYGLFSCQSGVAQDLKKVIAKNLEVREKRLAPDQQEALDMNCHKIDRTIDSGPEKNDSWVNSAGCAKHVVNRLQGAAR